ncbi:MAG: 50S ribosomal protein L17 [Prolixibacteraceae bacterium]|nr:50S ribosomal protein L17 [Prolixibacteraceae bacterium]
MRKNKKFNHLGRTTSHRKAMLSNMANSLIFHKRISTTLAKAKALRLYVEPLITKSKNDTTHYRRLVFSLLKSKTAVSELFREVAVKVGQRPGGYTRILKTGNRQGDNAEMCIIELVDFNDNMLKDTDAKKPARRSRRGGNKKATAIETTTVDNAVAEVEAPVANVKAAETKISEPETEAKKVIKKEVKPKEVKKEEKK